MFSSNAKIVFGSILGFLISTLCAGHKLSVGELPRKDNIHLVLPPDFIKVLPVLIRIMTHLTPKADVPSPQCGLHYDPVGHPSVSRNTERRT